MPTLLKERLKGLIDQTTSPVSAVGFGSLVCVSLALPDLTIRTVPDFVLQFHSSSDAFEYFKPKIFPLFLIFVTLFWYYRYKGAVSKELGLLDNVFEEDHAPLRLESLDRHKWLPYIGYALVLIYCLLIFLAPYIWLYCLGALALHTTDLIGSAIALQNINKTLARYPILGQNSKADFLKRRREIIKQYYFDNPTLPRIGIIFLITVAALVFSLKVVPTHPSLSPIPYLIMMINIVVAELVIGKWRSRRDEQLDAVWLEEDNLNAVPNN